MIPRIIHQSWKTNDVPEPWLALQKTWRSLHASYEYRFWTDDDNRNLIVRHYSEHLELYESYPLGIHRAELARYLVLRHHGGLYVDLDFEALRPIDDLLAGASLLFGLEPASHAAREPVRKRGFSRIVCNALMASAPAHPFWDYLLARLIAARGESNVLDATGPFLLTQACETYPQMQGIVFAPAKLLYPVDVEEARHLDADAIRAKAEGAYAIHHWSGSWWRDSLLARARQRMKRDGANEGREEDRR